MRTIHTILLVAFTFMLACGQRDGRQQSANNVSESPVLFGDPFIMPYNGMYYAYGTNAADGIQVYTSNDLKKWKLASELALYKNDSWGGKWFWAPEVYSVNGKFYMYYSANEHICVATADSPLGPFRQAVQEPMLPDEKCIDNSLFIDTDGKAYLYFVRFNDGLNVWVAELDNDLQTIRQETMTPCIHVSQAWEEVWPRVNEGPFITKHKDIYYLTYSANSYESPFYGIGYATATSPMGPWTKYDRNPICQKADTLVGIGHSAMFNDLNGKLNIVFHAHHDQQNIHPRIMYIAGVRFGNEEVPVMYIENNIERPSLVLE